ncbi:MAG TPA: hypothetical protein VIY49_29460 [Bryobacteraceae bacterium]
MTITLKLTPEVEAGLLTRAQAEGLGVSDYVQHLVLEKIAARPDVAARPAYELPPEEWIRKFDAWTESHAALNLPPLFDEDISRESIYRERGL